MSRGELQKNPKTLHCYTQHCAPHFRREQPALTALLFKQRSAGSVCHNGHALVTSGWEHNHPAPEQTGE